MLFVFCMWKKIYIYISFLKKISGLLRGITSKKNRDLYCLNCHHPFRIKNKLEYHKKVCENKDFCNFIMRSEDNKIIEFNQCQKSDKAPFIIQAVFECTIEKIDGCKNNPENLSTTRVRKHIPLGFSISTIYSFWSTENKHLYIEVKIVWKSVKSL